MLKQGFVRVADCILCKYLSVVYVRNIVKSCNLSEAVLAVKQ